MATATKEKTAEAATPKSALPSMRKLNQKDFKQADFAYNRWSVTLPYGWKFEDCLNPEFWTNVSHLLGPSPQNGFKACTGDIIEVRTVDSAFYGQLYVRAVREQALIVAVLLPPVSLVPKQANEPTGNLGIRFNAGKQKYEVIRRSDATIVGEGFDLKETALAFIDKMEV